MRGQAALLDFPSRIAPRVSLKGVGDHLDHVVLDPVAGAPQQDAARLQPVAPRSPHLRHTACKLQLHKLSL